MKDYCAVCFPKIYACPQYGGGDRVENYDDVDENEYDDDLDEEDEDESVDYSGRAGMFRNVMIYGGKPEAFYALGCLVQDSQADLCADVRAAARWYQRAVDDWAGKGHGLSAIALSTMLLHGDSDDLPRDVDRAKRLLTVASENGNMDATNLLGTM